MAKINEKMDVVFLDPPRKGLDNPLIESLLTLEPNKIVYVSCNPKTQVENLYYLELHLKKQYYGIIMQYLLLTKIQELET